MDGVMSLIEPSKESSVASCASLAVLALLGAGCGDDGGGSSPQHVRNALESAVDEVTVPSVVAFATEAEALDERASDFCDRPDAAGLSALRDAWRALSLEWSGAVIYYFGPLRDDLIAPSMIFIESMRLRGTDYTETVREGLTEAITTDVPLTPSYFEELSFNEVGMLALEVAIFESSVEPHATDVADVVDDYVQRPRKCAYLRGISRLLRERARSVRSGWTEDFDGSGVPYREVLLRGELEDGSDPVARLFVQLIDHLTYVQRRKLDGILDAKIADFFFSNQEATLDEIESLMRGGPDGFGFFDAMNARGFQADVELVEGDLEAGFEAARGESRVDLSAAVSSLEASLRAAVPRALGVDLGINFADGD